MYIKADALKRVSAFLYKYLYLAVYMSIVWVQPILGFPFLLGNKYSHFEADFEMLSSDNFTQNTDNQLNKS